MTPTRALATTCFCTHAAVPSRHTSWATTTPTRRQRAPAAPATPPRTRSARSPARATLLPQECRWGSEADRLAIEAEFRLGRRGTRGSPAVDADMGHLRERMAAAGDRARRDVCGGSRALADLADRMGVALVDVVSGEPTAVGWLMLSVSATVPLMALCAVLQVVQAMAGQGGAGAPLL